MYKEKSYWCLQLQFPTQTFPIKRSEENEKKNLSKKILQISPNTQSKRNIDIHQKYHSLLWPKHENFYLCSYRNN